VSYPNVPITPTPDALRRFGQAINYLLGQAGDSLESIPPSASMAGTPSEAVALSSMAARVPALPTLPSSSTGELPRCRRTRSSARAVTLPRTGRLPTRLLLSKEIGLETDTRKWKVGDGTTAWNSLAYYNSVPAGVSTFNTRSGAITLTSGDVTTALTFTPAQATHTHAYTDITSVPTGTLFYRKTAGTGAAETQTLATLKTDLGLSNSNSGDQTIILTGDVTGSGTGSFAATIAAGAVTFAKMQSSTAASVLLGRGSASGAGAFQEITLGTGLVMSGTSVTVSGNGQTHRVQRLGNLDEGLTRGSRARHLSMAVAVLAALVRVSPVALAVAAAVEVAGHRSRRQYSMRQRLARRRR
jgi:hypothetical protein